jgi:membrane-associated phospholipid phosphatase
MEHPGAAILGLAPTPRRGSRLAIAPVKALTAFALALALGAAAAVVGAAGLTVEAAGFARFAVLSAAMLALSLWCRRRHPDPRLGEAAAVVGAATLSLMLCGVIANAGLRLGAPLADARLAAIDAGFGVHVDRAVRAMVEWPWLIDGLAIVYNASGAAVVALITIALARNALCKAWELAATAVLAMQAVALLSIAAPAVGAMAHLGMRDLQGAGLPAGAGVYHLAAFAHFYGGGDPVLRLANLSGLVTFPSFHTVLALLATQALWDTRMRWAGVGWSAAVIVSTIPIGGHYVIDLAAGFAVWALCASLVRRAELSSPST